MIDVAWGLITALLTFATEAARALTADALVIGSLMWLAGLLLVIVRPR